MARAKKSTAKSKSRKATAKKATKKPPAKKATPKKAPPRKTAKSKSRSRRSEAPAVGVPNHRFPAGTTVGFHPAHTVGVERGLGREPFADPAETAKVGKDGTLEVRGLAKGQWCAVGPVGDRYAFVQFSVK